MGLARLTRTPRRPVAHSSHPPTLRQLLNGLGWIPLVGVLAGASATITTYAAGETLEAIFWLLIVGLSGHWLSSNLRSINRRLEESARPPGPPTPFPARTIAKQERTVESLQEKVSTASERLDGFKERSLDASEQQEVQRLHREFLYSVKVLEIEKRHRDRMYQANILVANGTEPFGVAIGRVSDCWNAESNAALKEHLRQEREASEDNPISSL